MKIKKVISLSDFSQKFQENPAYEQVAIDACSNLGGPSTETYQEAMAFLYAVANETKEKYVVEEVNFWIDEE